MLYAHVILHNMARGESGRIVLEIDPSQKDELYSALIRDGFTLKDWFLRQATQYLRDRGQLPLFGEVLVSEEPASYKAVSKKAPAQSGESKKHTRTRRGK